MTLLQLLSPSLQPREPGRVVLRPKFTLITIFFVFFLQKSLLILIDTFYGVNLCCFGVIFPFLLCFKYIQLFVSLISAHARSMC